MYRHRSASLVDLFFGRACRHIFYKNLTKIILYARSMLKLLYFVHNITLLLFELFHSVLVRVI